MIGLLPRVLQLLWCITLDVHVVEGWRLEGFLAVVEHVHDYALEEEEIRREWILVHMVQNYLGVYYYSEGEPDHYLVLICLQEVVLSDSKNYPLLIGHHLFQVYGSPFDGSFANKI